MECPHYVDWWKGEDGRGSVSLDPVRLESFTRVITAAGLSVFSGQEVHVVMNFLLSELRDCLADPVLIDCPALVRVSMNWFSFCFERNTCLCLEG